ncbi:MAG: DUF2752 domain-containing protein [Lachnospiraceae bacterium]|nr:DUF2752 domain-containing protein [Lachnospiraceae bacterium]
MKKKRMLRLITYVLLIAMAGFVYGMFVRYTGLAIPCPFRQLTGLKCPGCGVTGMCVALMQLDFKAAFLCNPMLFLLLAPLGAVLAASAASYVNHGAWKLKRWQNTILYVSIALLVVFCAVRNILCI